MKTQKLFFTPKKETPGTVQYAECTAKGTPKPTAQQCSRTLYMSKQVIGTDEAEWPALLTVTIEGK